MLLLLLISDKVGKQFGSLGLDLVVVVLVCRSGKVAIGREGHAWMGLVIVVDAIASCYVPLLRLLLHHHALENELNLSLNHVLWYGRIVPICCHCRGASHHILPLAVVFTSEIKATNLAIVLVAAVVLLLALIVFIW